MGLRDPPLSRVYISEGRPDEEFDRTRYRLGGDTHVRVWQIRKSLMHRVNDDPEVEKLLRGRLFADIGDLDRRGIPFDFSLYEVIFDGDLDAHHDPNRVYSMLQERRPQEYSNVMYSLSVGDIFEMDRSGRMLMVMGIGFEDITDRIRTSCKSLKSDYIDAGYDLERHDFYVVTRTPDGVYHYRKSHMMGDGFALDLAMDEVKLGNRLSGVYMVDHGHGFTTADISEENIVYTAEEVHWLIGYLEKHPFTPSGWYGSVIRSRDYGISPKVRTPIAKKTERKKPQQKKDSKFIKKKQKSVKDKTI